MKTKTGSKIPWMFGLSHIQIHKNTQKYRYNNFIGIVFSGPNGISYGEIIIRSILDKTNQKNEITTESNDNTRNKKE